MIIQVNKNSPFRLFRGKPMYLKIFQLRDKMRDIEDIVTGARASYWSLICHELRRNISHRQRAFVFISISIANFGSLRYGAL